MMGIGFHLQDSKGVVIGEGTTQIYKLSGGCLAQLYYLIGKL